MATRARTTAERSPLLRVEKLSVCFETEHGPVAAVRDVSFTVAEGEIVGIVGESGSGKSVTCRAVLGLLPATALVSGTVVLDGRDLTRLSEKALRSIRGRQASMIFQNPASHLDPLMTAGDHISEPLRFHLGYDRRRCRRTAIEMLHAVRIRDPEQRVDAYPHELSGGMKQRAMIASAIACQPRLLLADEPTTALDVTVQARILELLRQLNAERQLSIILVSHDLGVIAEVCDRAIVMRDGIVVEHGPVRDIIARPTQAYTKLLIDSQPTGKSRRQATGGPVTTAGQRDTVLAVENLTVEFATRPSLFDRLRRRGGEDAVRAVDNVSFVVRPGEVFGIVGESGSGKSTIARTVVRLLSPASGQILYRHAAVHALKGDELKEYRRSVQMIFQNPFDSLNPRLSAEETISEPLIRHRLVPRDKVRPRVAELMDLVELPQLLLPRRPRQLSGGQCQRVGIARALAMNPELLIADEITSALDVTIQAQILALLERLRERVDLTILFISHDLALVRMFCQRVAVFQLGRLVEMGDVDQVLANPTSEYTRTLIASAPRLDRAAN